ncbi:MAG: RNA polymerase subunit sigma, partial [Planctomycetales bacterium]
MVLKYQDRLYNTVFHVVGHAEDARDIVQEVLVQAFLKLDTFRQESAFYTWL